MITRDGPSGAGSPECWTGPLDYQLPEELIAQTPAERRPDSRLMVVERGRGVVETCHFRDITEWLGADRDLVVNDSRVVPARLMAAKPTGGRVELLVLDAADSLVATAMFRSSKPLRPGTTLTVGRDTATVEDIPKPGRVRVRFERSVLEVLEEEGALPLPPYIERESGPSAEDRERYQTVYASPPGSVAAPTAGLHFTQDLLRKVEAAGNRIHRVTLHVGPGTFTPIRGSAETHRMDGERVVLGAETAAALESGRREGRRLTAVGTTVVRSIEGIAAARGRLEEFDDEVDLFIRPGHEFLRIHSLITNFHLPGSTLLALVQALGGKEEIREAYRQAVAERWRFYSFGDAMLIL